MPPEIIDDEAEMHLRERAREDEIDGQDFDPDLDDHDEEDPVGSCVAT